MRSSRLPDFRLERTQVKLPMSPLLFNLCWRRPECVRGKTHPSARKQAVEGSHLSPSCSRETRATAPLQREGRPRAPACGPPRKTGRVRRPRQPAGHRRHIPPFPLVPFKPPPAHTAGPPSSGPALVLPLLRSPPCSGFLLLSRQKPRPGPAALLLRGQRSSRSRGTRPRPGRWDGDVKEPSARPPPNRRSPLFAARVLDGTLPSTIARRSSASVYAVQALHLKTVGETGAGRAS